MEPEALGSFFVSVQLHAHSLYMVQCWADTTRIPTCTRMFACVCVLVCVSLRDCALPGVLRAEKKIESMQILCDHLDGLQHARPKLKARLQGMDIASDHLVVDESAHRSVSDPRLAVPMHLRRNSSFIRCLCVYALSPCFVCHHVLTSHTTT